MKFLTAFFFVISTISAFAQFGVSGSWLSLRADEWFQFAEPENGGNSSVSQGFGVGVDYWFRLKEKRVEFLPELRYGMLEKEIEASKFKHQLLSFFFNVNLYPFDFGSDCNCPTWSKTGNFFTKGFFLQFSPGISGMRNHFGDNLNWTDKTVAWTIGGGAGVDIGLSDFFTVTPFFKYHFYPNVTWQELGNKATAPMDVESDVKILAGGIRLGFRPKHSR